MAWLIGPTKAYNGGASISVLFAWTVLLICLRVLVGAACLILVVIVGPSATILYLAELIVFMDAIFTRKE